MFGCVLSQLKPWEFYILNCEKSIGLRPRPFSHQQGVLFKLPLCKTVQFQCTYFYRTARLWNTLPFVIRDASSLQIFRNNLNELYPAMVNLFDVNNRCTWSLARACVNCRI